MVKPEKPVKPEIRTEPEAPEDMTAIWLAMLLAALLAVSAFGGT